MVLKSIVGLQIDALLYFFPIECIKENLPLFASFKALTQNFQVILAGNSEYIENI